MKLGIIGCGLIGQKRAAAARALGHELAVVVDRAVASAETLATSCGARVAADWAQVATHPDLDAVIIATSHDSLSPIAVACLDHGKHVLVEKPAGRNLAEVSAVAEAARRSGCVAKAGYNHRFHPAILRAREIVDTGAIGPLMYVRGRYGHGGRIGYEKEWRFDRKVSGGGELVDQGSHLIDLAHWFLGDITNVQSALRTYFWSTDVEDNCFLLLGTATGQIAWLHATWTEWKNLFSFEIVGRTGKLVIDGLGGSYGVESLTFYRMLPQLGPPETTRWEWPFPDRSWEVEFGEFATAIAEGRKPVGDIEDAVSTMSVIEQVYGFEAQ